MKKAILVVSFGTSHEDTRLKTIDRIERALDDAFPDRKLYRAWTSGIIIRKIYQRDGTFVPTVPEAMQQMRRDGIEDILVQPTHILNGVENDLMIKNINSMSEGFKSIRFAQPLLTSDEDINEVVEILTDKFTPIDDNTAVVYMGHGTSHYTNPVYAALDYKFKDIGNPNIYMGTVEAYPTVENIIKMLRQRSEIKKVILAPFMIVAGDHAKNDMSGDDEDSWKSLFRNEGYEVECVVKGIGEYDEIANMFVQHARTAEKESE